MRYKEFNPNAVLKKMTPIFWKDGFGATPVKSIVEATSVNRFSLYDQFENKNGLLYASLDLYLEKIYQEKFLSIDSAISYPKAIEDFMASYLIKEPGHPEGCYMIHIASELADTDAIVKEKLENYLSKVEEHLYTLIVKINEDSASIIAKHLIGLFCSIMCYSVILDKEEQSYFIKNGINLILSKYAT